MERKLIESAHKKYMSEPIKFLDDEPIKFLDDKYISKGPIEHSDYAKYNFPSFAASLPLAGATGTAMGALGPLGAMLATPLYSISESPYDPRIAYSLQAPDNYDNAATPNDYLAAYNYPSMYKYGSGFRVNDEYAERYPEDTYKLTEADF